MLLFIHVSGDKLIINDSTGLTEPTGKKAPPRKPKITIGKFRKFWIIVKLLIASPKTDLTRLLLLTHIVVIMIKLQSSFLLVSEIVILKAKVQSHCIS